MTRRLKIACIAGARPNFVKMAAVLEALRGNLKFEARLIHTGQHYSAEMSEQFFQELDMPRPDVNLQVGPGSQTGQTAEIMRRLEPVLEAEEPVAVLVTGDVNSTLAGALTAAKMGVLLAHVEAGLRSYDRTMPEEINRVVTDALSDLLFVSEPSGVNNLLGEGVAKDKVFLVGNVMIDTLVRFREKADRSTVLERMRLSGEAYAVVTLHRPSNVDVPERLRGMMEMLSKLAERLPVVFPVHPRTKEAIERAGIATNGVRAVPPLGYLDFMKLLMGARLVMTDSGGIQEETTALQVPCVTLRKNTERPITVEEGTNELAGDDPSAALAVAMRALDTPRKAGRVPELWDGKAGRRIALVLEERLAGQPCGAGVGV